MKRDAMGGGFVGTVDANSNLRRAAGLMSARQVGSLLVTDDGRIRGIITEGAGKTGPEVDRDFRPYWIPPEWGRVFFAEPVR